MGGPPVPTEDLSGIVALAFGGDDKFVIDNYQSEFSTDVSSSGGAVTFDVSNVFEDLLRDTDVSFEWLPSDPMNGMLHARTSDRSRGVVFDFSGEDRYYELEIIPEQRDFSGRRYLSFRACQGTRHPAFVRCLAYTATWVMVDLPTSRRMQVSPFLAMGWG